MLAHEVAGVLVASIIAVSFVSAIQPNSQMANLLSTSTQGWAGVLSAIRGK